MIGKCLTLIIFLCSTLTTKCQSVFSIIHLNEETQIHKGIPQSITESKAFYNSNGIENKREFTEFDQSGLPITKTFFDENQNVTSIVSYKYDTVKRRILESKILEINTRFHTRKNQTVYYYESSICPIKVQYLSLDGEILTEVLLKNNSFGLPVELQLFEPQGNLIGIEIASHLPAENKTIVSVLNRKGEIISTDTMKTSFKNAYKFNDPNIKYNDKGDVIFSQSKWFDGSIHFKEYDYVYDSSGNWTEEKIFELTYKSSGKKKRELKSYFKRDILYWTK